jgi:prepilin-type processing-associated H-X9-DG protein
VAIIVAKVPRSSEVVFLTEAHAASDTNLLAYHDVWDPSHLPADGTGRPQPGARVMNDNRHRGRVNLLFLDGHVGSKTFREIIRRDFDYLWTREANY